MVEARWSTSEWDEVSDAVRIRTWNRQFRGRFCFVIRWRTTITAAVACHLTFILLLASAVHALDSNKRLTQYMHTAWRTQDGSLPAGMFSIAQTSDGFLWFTSVSQGMYRFDGIRFVPWTLPVDGRTIDHIVSVHSDHADGLWAVGGREVVPLKGWGGRFPFRA